MSALAARSTLAGVFASVQRAGLGACVSALVLAGAFGLKLAYSKAGAAELEWVLGPSCLLAKLGGIPLAKEAGAGWITHEPRMVVGAACAGVNFLVVCWLALYFSVQQHFSARGKLGLLVLSLAGAYLATISTNGLRILLAARLYDTDIYAGWLTAARVHRALGVVLYCSTLFGLCRAAELWATRTAAKPDATPPRKRPTLAPFYWYLAVAIGVPLANRSFVRNPGHFLEHAAMTVAVGLAVFGAFWALADRLSSRRAAS